MNDAEIESLMLSDIDRGDRAERANKIYIDDFIKQSDERIFNKFKDLSITDIDGLQKLKLMQYSIHALAANIKGDIDASYLAKKQLEQLQGNR